jgi:hypothetical protein
MLLAIPRIVLEAASCCGPPLISNESRNGVIWNQCDTAQFAALSNPNELPVSLLLAFVVVAPA